ncbi:hypothetical protein [Flagellimonas zhangzhouensis]|uniref:Acetyl esterase/lipase n=1 Tax=Flagellimonas zhangzhouensis TaxID=1073328 RepID=A0A1H2TZQ6_9FLAO|nr:hypothetical protein [Allomuricauda zhangzhouensis]SDQ21690.1 Acetyl esterase/lipase [Allomuricauda zhangzhouensis]SDW49396.1 Acetyl esterase/lipase [Allomuricauda zhangzhouensis]
MKKAYKSINSFNLLVLFTFLLWLACSKDDDSGFNHPISTEVVVSSKTTDTIVYTEVNNSTVPIYISIPEGCDNPNFPAVVVMHGSDGMWSDHDINTGKMSGQNNDWRELFDQNCIIGVYVDSYSGRGTPTRRGDWEDPPKNFKISSQFIRPRDANAALALIKELKYKDGTRLVRPEDVGLVGFSDGAASVAATLFDTNAIPDGWEWNQSFGGKEYYESDGVLPPEPKPTSGFAGGIFYYGGSVGHNYFGKHPCGDEAYEKNFYQPYAPMLYQIPTEGYLTENTLCMVYLLQQKGMPVTLNLYEGVGHGFDFEDTEQSAQARASSMVWLRELLHMNQ